jgi:hypothetical protein
MAKTNKLPADVKQECLWIVRGYERRKRDYRLRREEILNSTPDSKGNGGQPGNPVEQAAIHLLKLESHPEVLRMRAVENALKIIGADIKNDKLRDKLRDAVYKNCLSGRKYPYERLDVDGVSRMGFYRQKTAFLLEIAEALGYIA